jgi:hypothetical protein
VSSGLNPRDVTLGAGGRGRDKSAPARPPPIPPITAVVHTFRSLSIASSNLLRPMKTPAAKPAPAPTIVQITRLLMPFLRGVD